MPEIQKYNLNEKLNEANKKYAGSPAIAGMSAMTHFRYNNSTRTQMFTSHLNQAINMKTPQVPLVPTGAENVVGMHSSFYKKIKHKSKVFRKVEKFKDLIEKPFVYQLFYWDEEKMQYDVVERKEGIDQSQTYGVAINNEVIDQLQEGDEIEPGTVLWRSTSYDEDMNYRYGYNLNTMYSFDPYTAEDAAEISEFASEAMTTFHSQVIEWGWNNNDIPINLHGTDSDYRPLPNIGSVVEGVFASSRPLINDQVSYDFKKENLRISRDGDREITYLGSGTVVDYEIYCNNDELPNNSFNKQIIELLESQKKYWEEVYETCNEIIRSGKDYSKKVDNLYDRAMKFLNFNPKEKWFDGSTVHSNLKFKAHVIEFSPLAEGGKFTARYGNKSVVSRVIPNHLMPFDKNGRRVDVILHQPAITNRTTGFVPHEMHINFINDLAVIEMKKMKTLKEREKFLFELIHDYNVEQYTEFYSVYKKLNKEEKEAYIQDVLDNGIIIYVDSINEDESIFFKLLKMREKYSFIKPQTMFIYKWGRIYRLANRYCCGKMYYFPLKQTDQRGFSARNTGAINMKGLPERSYKNKRNEAPFSDTAIRFGEYETLNFLIGTDPEELALVHAFYRSSPEAMSDLTKAQFVERGLAQFKPFYKNRSAEIFNVFYKHLGHELIFIDSNNIVKGYDNFILKEHVHKGRSYLMTDLEFKEFERREEIREKLLEKYLLLETKDLNEKIEEVLNSVPFVTGKVRDDLNIFGTTEELTDE